jgi:acetyl-CoA carboxylase beta subunit
LTLPLPNVYGPVWISITREDLAENRQQGKAVLGWLAGEKLIDETERERLGQTIQASNLLFGHQAYDLILRGLRTGEAAPDIP